DRLQQMATQNQVFTRGGLDAAGYQGVAIMADVWRKKRQEENGKKVTPTGFRHMKIEAGEPLQLSAASSGYLGKRGRVAARVGFAAGALAVRAEPVSLFRAVDDPLGLDPTRCVEQFQRRGFQVNMWRTKGGHAIAVDCGPAELAFFDPNLGEF